MDHRLKAFVALAALVAGLALQWLWFDWRWQNLRRQLGAEKRGQATEMQMLRYRLGELAAGEAMAQGSGGDTPLERAYQALGSRNLVERYTAAARIRAEGKAPAFDGFVVTAAAEALPILVGRLGQDMPMVAAQVERGAVDK